MPKRKVSIEEAFDTLREAGIRVQVESVKEPELESPPLRAKSELFERKVGKHSQRIFLYAQHMISNPGSDDPEQPTTQVFGPGWVTVVNALAAPLLHQDQTARRVDAEFRDRTNKCYMVVRKQSPGSSAYSKVQVDESVFMDLTKLGSAYMI